MTDWLRTPHKFELEDNRETVFGPAYCAKCGMEQATAMHFLGVPLDDSVRTPRDIPRQSDK